MRGREVVRARRAHEDVAVQAEVLLHVFAHVRVVPVDARVGKAQTVDESPARAARAPASSSGTPSNRLSSRMPCQCTVVGWSRAFVKSTTTFALCATRSSGPGYWPLKPYMMSVRPLNARRTRPAASRSVSPVFSVTTSRGRAAGTAAFAEAHRKVTPPRSAEAPSRPGASRGSVASGFDVHRAPEPRAVSGDAWTCPAPASRVAPMVNWRKSGGWRRVLGDAPRSTSGPTVPGRRGSARP